MRRMREVKMRMKKGVEIEPYGMYWVYFKDSVSIGWTNGLWSIRRNVGWVTGMCIGVC